MLRIFAETAYIQPKHLGSVGKTLGSFREHWGVWLALGIFEELRRARWSFGVDLGAVAEFVGAWERFGGARRELRKHGEVLGSFGAARENFGEVRAGLGGGWLVAVNRQPPTGGG